MVGGGSMLDVRLFLRDDDVTSGLPVSRSRTTVGARCMRRQRHVTVTWSEALVLRAEHDGNLVNCSVVVPRHPVPVSSETATLSVRCE